MIDIKTRRLKDTIPENLLRDKKVADLSEVFTEESDKISIYAYKLNYTMNVRDLPESVIDHLLWENHINRPEEGLLLAKNIDEKINLLEASIELHRRKGTPYAIERVLQAVNIKGDVVEWFETNSEPYHFLVEIQPTKEINQIENVRQLVMHYKNKRSWFDGFVILLEGGDVIVIDDSYHYPVYYPLCGQFWGEKQFSQLNGWQINVTPDDYEYVVNYPVTQQEFSQFDQDDIAAVDDTYSYPKVFPLTGEMYPLIKQTEMSVDAVRSFDENYQFEKKFRLCGQFAVEKE